MCGIAGIASLRGSPDSVRWVELAAMSRLLAHRGPDGAGEWQNPDRSVGLAHRRLSIIDLSDHAAQPMVGPNQTTMVFNGEIYNYVELREALQEHWLFRTHSDTECILAVYDRYRSEALHHLRGMFAFALWDEAGQRLFCAGDRFGIKPFYYAVIAGRFIFASEVKALLPFLPDVATDANALAEYLTFQYTLGEHTLFQGVQRLLPGHALMVENGTVRIWRYWDVRYEIDYDHSLSYFSRRLAELTDESMRLHLRADVPVGSYLSGGIDSSLIVLLAAKIQPGSHGHSFHGKFARYPGYDESNFALAVAEQVGNSLHEIDIVADDFRRHIRNVIYYLDYPVAGPGSFPQYMVSGMAARHLKVVLGGQGGDEIFGGYARYLVACFEQGLQEAIDGTSPGPNHPMVALASLIPNLGVLQEYKPLLQEFWRSGLFGPLDERYFRLIDRSADMVTEIDWRQLDRAQVFDHFRTIFNDHQHVDRKASFDKMTRFDFKCLLPALLQVEDRMSMAHGLESRVPFLDHPLVEFVATVPAEVKFEGGQLKHLLKTTFRSVLPTALLRRRDKMGFPVPLREWFNGELQGLIHETFDPVKLAARPYLNLDAVMTSTHRMGRYSRKVWGLLSLELWHQLFHDQAATYRAMVDDPTILPPREVQ